MGNGVHFMFDAVSRLKFSVEYGGAGPVLKKGTQSALPGGATTRGSEIRFITFQALKQ